MSQQIGTVTTFAGGALGNAIGNDDQVRFKWPRQITTDRNGNIYVAVFGNHCILKRTKAGEWSILAGTPGKSGFRNGDAHSALFFSPSGIVVDDDGNVFVADSGNNQIRKISNDTVSTLAGSVQAGHGDGHGSSVHFKYPIGLALGPDGVIIVADYKNHCIRKVSRDGTTTTLAGSGKVGYQNGTRTSALFTYPWGVAVDVEGVIFVGDSGNHTIRKISPDGVVTTLSGSGKRGYADGQGTNARFNLPTFLTVNKAGTVFVSDSSNDRIRTVTADGKVFSLAGSGQAGLGDGIGVFAHFFSPMGVVIDGESGDLLVADEWNHRIRRIVAEAITEYVNFFVFFVFAVFLFFFVIFCFVIFCFLRCFFLFFENFLSIFLLFVVFWFCRVFFVFCNFVVFLSFVNFFCFL